jgi:hypothetical protein
MARIAVGAITIADIADGGSPIAAFLTNENHTFAAGTNGTISSIELAVFTTTVSIFLGTTAGTFKSTTVTTAGSDANKFSIGTITTSAATWATTTNASTGAITLTAAPTGTSNLGTTLTVPVTVNDTSATLKNITLVITLSKQLAGAGGQIVQMTANKQHFQFDEYAVLSPAGQNNITLTIDTQGATGALVAQKSIDGGVYTTLAQGSGAGFASAIDIDGLNANDNIVITPTNFGTSNTMTVRVTGANDGSDSVSLVRIRDGVRGASSLFVALSSSDGTLFKNNAGSAKTITCEIWDQIDGSAVTHVGTSVGQRSVNFNWQRVDAGGSNADVFVTTGTRVVSATGDSADGYAATTLIIGPEDISDNSSTQFSCEVTVTEN